MKTNYIKSVHVAVFIFFILLASVAYGQKTVTTDLSTKPDGTIIKVFWEKRFLKKRHYLRTHSCNLLFMGDSITHSWDWADNQASWKQYYGDRNAYDIGMSGARTESLLWMLKHGILGKSRPKLVVLLIGTNNIDPIHFTVADNAYQTAEGVLAITSELKKEDPHVKILLLGIFPRGDQPSLNPRIQKINSLLKESANGKWLFFKDIGGIFLLPNGRVNQSLLKDLIHPSPAGYFAWANAIEPSIDRLLGPVPDSK